MLDWVWRLHFSLSKSCHTSVAKYSVLPLIIMKEWLLLKPQSLTRPLHNDLIAEGSFGKCKTRRWLMRRWRDFWKITSRKVWAAGHLQVSHNDMKNMESYLNLHHASVLHMPTQPHQGIWRARSSISSCKRSTSVISQLGPPILVTLGPHIYMKLRPSRDPGSL